MCFAKKNLFCEVIHTYKLQKFIKNIAHANIQIIILKSLVIQKNAILKILNCSMDRLFLIYYFHN